MALRLCKKLSVVGAYVQFSVERVQYFQQILKGVYELSPPHPPRRCCQVKLLTLEAPYSLPGGSLAPFLPPNLGQ